MHIIFITVVLCMVSASLSFSPTPKLCLRRMAIRSTAVDDKVEVEVLQRRGVRSVEQDLL